MLVHSPTFFWRELISSLELHLHLQFSTQDWNSRSKWVVMRSLISFLFVCYQSCERCNGLLPSSDQLPGMLAHKQVCLSLNIHWYCKETVAGNTKVTLFVQRTDEVLHSISFFLTYPCYINKKDIKI